MPRDDENVTDQTPEIEPEITHENGDAETAGRIAKLEQNQAMLQLLGDPDVRAVLEAKRGGKKVKVVDETPEPEPELPSITEGMAEDDPSRGLLEKIEKLTKAQAAHLEARLQSRLEPLSQRLAGVEGMAQTVQERDVRDQVKGARDKYKDLDQFKEGMVELAKGNPSLGVEELYLLAKHKAGKLKLAEQNTFSEKPSSQPSRPNRPAGQKPVYPSGRKGFNEMLTKALGGLDLSEVK